MDQTQRDKEEKFRQQVRQMLRKMSTDELSYTLGRYCGPSNIMLCEKKFGFIIPKELVESELKDRTFEDAIFFSDTE